jgi:hypothetical protein
MLNLDLIVLEHLHDNVYILISINVHGPSGVYHWLYFID